MGVRGKDAGVAGCRLRGIAASLLLLGLASIAGIHGEARAFQAARPLDHHAIVVNGRVAGSAFALYDGIAVTNAHVVRGLRPGAHVALVAARSGRVRAPARVLAISRRMDLAILAVPAGFLKQVAAANAPARTGSRVIAAGIDAGTGAWPPLEAAGEVLEPRIHLPSYGNGLVARLPGVRPGFSGGPVLDAEGRLVGMVTAIREGPYDAHGAIALSGFAPRQRADATEAFVLRAADIRAEADRLLARR
jgi:S1-C subfamily serine protease